MRLPFQYSDVSLIYLHFLIIPGSFHANIDKYKNLPKTRSPDATVRILVLKMKSSNKINLLNCGKFIKITS